MPPIGYVYCFVNDAMPGICKIGMTTRTPRERLNDANSSNTWKPPVPYRMVLNNKVRNPEQKERSIHKILEKMCERIHPRREFFRIDVETVGMLFSLLDNNIDCETCLHELIDPKKDMSNVSSSNTENVNTFVSNSDDEKNIYDACVSRAKQDNPFSMYAFTGSIDELMYGSD